MPKNHQDREQNVHSNAKRSHKAHESVLHIAEMLEARCLLAAVIWDGGGDGTNWNDPRNWSGDVLPGPANDVTISVEANPTIQINSGTASINNLHSDEAISIAGGTLSVAAASQIDAGLSLSGGTLTGSGDVTITGTLNWGPNGTVFGACGRRKVDCGGDYER